MELRDPAVVVAVSLAWAASCAASPPAGLPPAPPLAPATIASAAPAASAGTTAPDVRVTARLPRRASYDARTLGISAASLSLVVANAGASPVPSDRVRVVLSASRDGAAIACGDARPTADAREPPTIDPGRTVTLVRDLDCAFPLPGTYSVEARVAVGDAPPALVATQDLDVVAASARVPQPVAGRPGLYAIVSGDPVARPRPPAAWARGDYAAVIGLVNGSAAPIALGRARVAFDVYRQGSNVRCAGEVRDLELPESLAPWRSAIVRAPITCAPQGEGEFVIVGRLALGGAGALREIGRFELRITNDPTLFTPLPERSGPGGPPYENPRDRPPL